MSSAVWLVEDEAGACVVKQALARLKVAADWRCDPARSEVEVACLELLREVLGPGAAPEVLWHEPERHRFAMTYLGPPFVPWKAQLMAGSVSPETAGRVGRMLGRLHAATAGREDVARRFAEQRFFEALRLAPYHGRIAERHPDLGPAIAAVAARTRGERRALVHGDFSPKNLMVAGPRVAVLDCEVAHYGDPRFDVGFLLSHLCLKIVRGRARAALAAAAEAFLAAYADAGLDVLDAAACRQLGCLVLARVDGDSPVEYLDRPETREAARRLGRRLIALPPPRPADALALALEEAP